MNISKRGFIGKAWIIVAIALLAVFASAGSSHLMAANGKKDCTVGDAYEKLKCRHDGLAEQLEYTANTAFGSSSKLKARIEPSRLKHIQNSNSKGARSVAKNDKTRFKKLAKDEARLNRNAGHLVPLDPDWDDLNDDGICDWEQPEFVTDDTQCAAIEVLITAEGEEVLQACNPMKKNKGKGTDGLECDRFYDSQDASTVEEEIDMEAAAMQMEETYSAVEDTFIEMNEHLDTVNANLPTQEAIVFLEDGNGCLTPEVTEGLSEAAAALRGLSAAAQGAASIMDSASGQTVVAFGAGGNGRAAAVIVNSAALAAEMAYITVDEIASAEAAAVQEATLACVKKVADDLAALRAQMINDHNQLKSEHQELGEDHVKITNILNTPHGQREEFPLR